MNETEIDQRTGQTLEQLLLREDARTKAVDKLMLCLDAKRSFYDGTAKKTVQEPDFKTISTAAIALLNYSDGKPIERKEIMRRTEGNLDDMMKRVRNSPAARAAIKKLAAQLEDGTEDAPVVVATEE